METSLVADNSIYFLSLAGERRKVILTKDILFYHQIKFSKELEIVQNGLCHELGTNMHEIKL